MRTLWLWVGFCVLGTGVALADAPSNCPECEQTLKQFESIRGSFTQALGSGTGCNLLSDRKDPACQFSQLCENLAPNKDSANLYRNKKGEIIPNYALFYAEQDVAACYMMSIRDLEMRRGVDPAKAYNKRATEYVHTQRKFLASVKKNKEESLYVDLQDESLKKILRDAAAGKSVNEQFMSYGGKTRDEHDKQLAELEGRLKKKFSPETRKLYLDYVTLESNLNTATQDEMYKGWKPMNDNPFLDTMRMTSTQTEGGAAKVKKNQARFQEEVDRSFGVFKQAQKSIIAVLEKKRNKQNGAAIDNMIKRISTIRFETAGIDPRGNFNMFANCPGPNAFYDPTFHAFAICPQVMQLPEAALKAIIAHEIGHSIDPCIATGPLKKVRHGRGLHSTAKLSDAELKEQAEKQGMLIYKATLPEVQDTQEYGVDLLGDLDRTLKYKYSYVKTTDEIPAVDPKTNPFASVVKCLATPASVGARQTASKAQIEKSLDSAIASLKQSAKEGVPNPQLDELEGTRKNLSALLASKGACSFVPGDGGRSQVQEAFSDWLSGEALAEDLKAAAPEARKDMTFESVSYFLGVGCSALRPSLSAEVDKVLEEQGCTEDNQTITDLSNLSFARAMNQDEHPFDVARVNRIFLAHPSMRQALGCGNKQGAKHCE